jgi:lipopolysaccharide export system permease protein
MLTFTIAMFILLLQFLWKYIDDLVGKGFAWNVIAELLFYASATFVPLALPLGILFASIMTLGKFGETSELVAIKSAGISFQRFIKPLIIFSAVLSLAAFYFSNNVLPVANLKMLSLLYDIRTQKPAVDIREGIFYSEIDNFVIKIGSKDKDGITIRDITIYDHTSRGGNTNVTYAKRGEMKITPDKRYLIFQLYEGYNYYENIRNNDDLYRRPLQTTRFKSRYQRIDLSEFSFEKTNEEAFKDHYRMLNLKQLSQAQDSMLAQMDMRYRDYSSYMEGGLRYISILDSNRRFQKGDSIPIYLKAPPADTTANLTTINTGSDSLSSHLIIGIHADSGQYSGYHYLEYLLPSATVQQQNHMLDNAVNLARNFKNQAAYVKNDLEGKVKLINRHRIEWHRKFTLSIACIILFFIGAPLGSIIRRGGLGMPTLVSTLLFVFYHVISIIGEKASREDVLDPAFGMWIASLFFLPAGIILTYKASTEASFLSEDAWSRLSYRIRNFIRLQWTRRKS